MKGLADLERRMSALSNDIATKVGQAANRAGTKVLADTIRKEAPVGPMAEGTLKKRKRKSGKEVEEKHRKIINSIKVQKVRAQPGSVENAVVVTAYHAAMVEFGSIHNTADPFMERGLNRAQEEAIEKLAKIIERRLKKAGV